MYRPHSQSRPLLPHPPHNNRPLHKQRWTPTYKDKPFHTIINFLYTNFAMLTQNYSYSFDVLPSYVASLHDEEGVRGRGLLFMIDCSL